MFYHQEKTSPHYNARKASKKMPPATEKINRPGMTHQPWSGHHTGNSLASNPGFGSCPVVQQQSVVQRDAPDAIPDTDRSRFAGTVATPAARSITGSNIAEANGSGFHPPSHLPVQRDAMGDATPGEIHSAAREGIKTTWKPLPYLNDIQRSFGAKHNISNIRYHEGPVASQSARQMNAKAYSTAGHVVSDGPISKHTAAHEAAHVVQQQAGVRLKDNVGSVGDKYERQADAVGDAVVQGKSAEGLLDRYTGSGLGVMRKEVAPASGIIQRKVGLEFQTVGGRWNVKKEEDGRLKKLEHGSTALRPRNNGWKLLNDYNDFEYVTDAFDESEAGILALRQAATSAANYHMDLGTSLGNDNWEQRTTRASQTMQKDIGGTIYVANLEGQQSAHPQATVGITLEKLLKYGEDLAKDRSRWRTTETLSLAKKRVGWSTKHPGSPLRGVATDSATLAKGEGGLSAKGKSFLFLVSTYVKGTQSLIQRGKAGTANAKNATAFMSRTNFLSLLTQLNPGDLTTLDTLLGADLGRNRLFGENDPALVTQSGREAGTNNAFLLSQWWAALRHPTTPEDLMQTMQDNDGSKAFHGLSDSSSLTGTTGPSDIGLAGTGVIIELRKLRNRVPPEEWGDFAEAIARTVKWINEVYG